jgi:hypothetical protein
MSFKQTEILQEFVDAQERSRAIKQLDREYRKEFTIIEPRKDNRLRMEFENEKRRNTEDNPCACGCGQVIGRAYQPDRKRYASRRCLDVAAQRRRLERDRQARTRLS